MENMKNIRTLLLIAMTIFTIAMIGLAGWMIFSEDGPLNSEINPFPEAELLQDIV